MKKNLYDILEVSQTASQEAIRAAYDRLSAKFDPDLPEHVGKSEIRVKYNLIKDAFFTLGNVNNRRQYDFSLRPTIEISHAPEAVHSWTSGKLIPLFLIVLIGGGYIWHHKNQQAKIKAILEYEQLVLKEKQIEAETKLETERIRAAQVKEREDERQASRQRAELEANRLYGDRVTRERELAGQREQLEARRRQEQQENKERQIAAERRASDYRAKQEAAEIERKVRLLEYEQRRKGGVTVIGTTTDTSPKK